MAEKGYACGMGLSEVIPLPVPGAVKSNNNVPDVDIVGAIQQKFDVGQLLVEQNLRVKELLLKDSNDIGHITDFKMLI